MTARTETAREQLDAIEKTLAPMINAAPEYGSLGIQLVYHAGRLTKIGTSLEVLRKTEEVR